MCVYAINYFIKYVLVGIKYEFTMHDLDKCSTAA